MKKLASIAVLVAVFLSAQAFGEMNVSVTINGPIDEIVALLQHLKELGIGSASNAPGAKYNVTITSVATTSTEAQQPLAQEPAPKPPLALAEAKAAASTVKPGESVLLTVKASDPDHQIDTIAATLDGAPGSTEFYDNGTQGDATASDGLWSATLALSPQIAPGEHTVNISAFNASGNPVMVATEGQPEAPLAAQIKVVVQP